MDIAILKKAGLNEAQAKGYIALAEHGQLNAPELAEKIGESRTNGYAIGDKLVQLGLAEKNETGTNKYRASHPSSVALLAERRRKVVVRDEQTVQNGLADLIDFFYTHSELPGTRTLEGLDGIKQVYQDTLSTKKDIYLLRTMADIPSLGEGFLDNYRERRAKLGINTYALTPDTPEARRHIASGDDERLLFHRTFLANSCYTAPVEIDVYGNKVAFIAFGETQMATIIDGPPIAEAMRQLLGLLAAQLRRE